jgi:tryptophanyl-tRNA synthetase
MTKRVILTGLRANSELHLGNYLGGILPIIELQQKHADEYQINMFVPDLHSFTTPIDHTKLYQQTLDNLRVFVAAGLPLDDSGIYIYRQSCIPAHSELTWILDCFTGMGELSRMTQYKDKGRDNDSAHVGLFNYPVLMAADILLYGAKYIPVGDDQKQHIELTRDLAIRLNNKFDQELFVVPEPWAKQIEFANRDNGVRIRSLRNPEKKMSKSVNDPSGTIMLSDAPADAAKKIMRAETDSVGVINYDFEKQPGISNMLQILALLSGKSQGEVNAEWASKTSYGDLKKATADAVEVFLTDFQAKLAGVDEQQVLAKLEQDEAAMNAVANETLLKVQKAVGLRK